MSDNEPTIMDLERLEIRVSVIEDRAVLTYRWAGFDVDGVDVVSDEGCADWTDDEMREVAWMTMGADAETEAEAEHRLKVTTIVRE